MKKESVNVGIWVSISGIIILILGYFLSRIPESWAFLMLYPIGTIVLIIGLLALIIGFFQKPKKK